MGSERYAVLILGHGEMGRVMEFLLSGRHQLVIWEKDLARGTENLLLEEAAPAADFICLMLPAAAHPDVAARLKGNVAAGATLVTVAKGLDGEGRPPTVSLREVLGPGPRIAVLYGPMIAEELCAGRPGFAELGCDDPDAARRVEDLFAGTPLHLRPCADVIGVSWAAVLKNVYAPLIGAAEELALGDNARGFLCTAATAEMGRIIGLLGGQPGNAFSLAGLADLVTTGSSQGSSHRAVGRDLVRPGRAAGSVPRVVEGIHSARLLAQLPALARGDFPLFSLLLDLLDDPADAPLKFMRTVTAVLRSGQAGPDPDPRAAATPRAGRRARVRS
jgi:glycerol-3-phosphate dehydrogenase (NAD(P)+)